MEKEAPCLSLGAQRATKIRPKYAVVHWDGKIVSYALGLIDDVNAVVLSGPGDCLPAGPLWVPHAPSWSQAQHAVHGKPPLSPKDAAPEQRLGHDEAGEDHSQEDGPDHRSTVWAILPTRPALHPQTSSESPTSSQSLANMPLYIHHREVMAPLPALQAGHRLAPG